MYQFPNCPFCYNSTFRQIETSYARVFHGSPGTMGVDVYANGDLIARNLRYRRFTPYLKIDSGQKNIKIYAAGQKNNPLVDTNITIRPNAIYTLSAVGKALNIEIYPIVDPETTIDPGKTNTRFIHLSPEAPPVDVALPDGTVLFSNVSYKGITEYKTLNPGRYTLQIRRAGTSNILLNVPNVILRRGINISVYFVGLTSGSPSLQVLIPLDGNTYLKP